MSDTIKVTIDDAAVQAAFNRLVAVAGDLSPAMRTVAGILADQAEEAFANQADISTGAIWADLADSTIAARKKKGYWPGQKLQQIGNLAKSIQEGQRHGGDFAEVGSNLEYAAIHQLGGKAGRGRKVSIPARPFLGLSPTGAEDITDALSDYIASVIP